MSRVKMLLRGLNVEGGGVSATIGVRRFLKDAHASWFDPSGRQKNLYWGGRKN